MKRKFSGRRVLVRDHDGAERRPAGIAPRLKRLDELFERQVPVGIAVQGRVADAKNELPESPVAGSAAQSMDFLAGDARVVQLAAYVTRRLAGTAEEGEGVPFLEGVPLIGLAVQDDQMDEAVGRGLFQAAYNRHYLPVDFHAVRGEVDGFHLHVGWL